MYFTPQAKLMMALGLTLLSLTSSAYSATCPKPKVTGYTYIGCLHDGLAGVAKDTPQGLKTGFVNAKGKLVIPIQYETVPTVEDAPEKLVPEFSEGLAAVSKETATGAKYGYIDTTGKTVIGFQYDDAKKFGSGLAGVRVGNQLTVINRQGKPLFNLPYDEVSSFSEGRAVVARQGYFGYIDTTGKLVLPIKFRFAEEDNIENYVFHQGKAIAYDKNEKPYCINMSGKTVACR